MDSYCIILCIFCQRIFCTFPGHMPRFFVPFSTLLLPCCVTAQIPEKIFVNHAFDIGLACRIYKELLRLNSKTKQDKTGVLTKVHYPGQVNLEFCMCANFLSGLCVCVCVCAHASTDVCVSCWKWPGWVRKNGH